MSVLRVLLFSLLTAVVYGQPGTPYDCFSVYTFSGATSQTGQNNASSAAPCVAWRVTYTSSGFSSVTVQFETSPDNSNWTAVPNSICSSSVQPPCVTDGSNPLAADVMGSASFRAYGKWVRVHVTGVTGTGSGQIVTYGYKGTSAGAGVGGGGSGGQTFPTVVTVESFGAVGNGTTDDTTAIQNAINSLSATGGTVVFGAKHYKTTAALTIPTSFIHLVGPASSNSVQPTLSASIVNNQTTGNIITLAGTVSGCGTDAITGFRVEHLQLLRSTPATAGYAVSVTKACDVQINDVVAYDSFHGFLLNFVGNPRMIDTWVVWTSASGSNRNGFEVDTTDGGSFTYYCERCVAAATNTTNGAHAKGFYLHGGKLSDFHLNSPETANLDHGAYIDFESGATVYGGDFVIAHPTFDVCLVSCATILNNVNLPYSDVKISDGWFNVLTGNGVVINKAVGTSVLSTKILCQNGSTIGAFITNGFSFHNLLIGNKITGCETGIKLDAAAITNLTGNDVSFATTGILLTGSANNNNVTGNAVFDNVATAFSADSEGFNTVVGNTFVGTVANIVNTGANYFAANSTYQTTQTPSLNVTSCAGAAKGSGALNLGGTITSLPTGACTIVMTFGAQPAETGWNCSFADRTTPANVFTQTASSTTTATVAGSGTSGDTLQYICSPF